MCKFKFKLFSDLENTCKIYLKFTIQIKEIKQGFSVFLLLIYFFKFLLNFDNY